MEKDIQRLHVSLNEYSVKLPEHAMNLSCACDCLVKVPTFSLFSGQSNDRESY